MKNPVVYSSDEFCEVCHSGPCRCAGRPATTAVPAARVGGGPKMRLEKSGRKGKAVTVIFNLGLSEDAARDLLRELQKACGSGGTVTAEGIEIQGDHRDRIENLLRGRGLAVKRAGG